MPDQPPEEAQESPLVTLVGLMARLRAECPWKGEQTHRSLARYLLEETHETVEAIEAGDPDHLREELGDLLLQVYFHAAIAAEQGEYDVEDVAADLAAKLVRRNPHVFAPSGSGPLDSAPTSNQVNEAWEHIKRAEKQRAHPTEGLPASLPALLWADKVIDRVGRDGSPVTADAHSDDLGERLLALAVEAHSAGLDAEQALRDAVRRRL